MAVLDVVKEFLRRRAIKQHRYQGKTRLLPLSEIHSAIIVVDVNRPGFDELRHDVNRFFRSYNIRPDIYFLDFRKLENYELLLTSIQTTILLKDLDWIGKPDVSKMPYLVNGDAELFLCLVPGDDFILRFLSHCACARFKVGITPFQGHPFDLVISGSDDTRLCFNQVKDYLEKIVL